MPFKKIKFYFRCKYSSIYWYSLRKVYIKALKVQFSDYHYHLQRIKDAISFFIFYSEVSKSCNKFQSTKRSFPKRVVKINYDDILNKSNKTVKIRKLKNKGKKNLLIYIYIKEAKCVEEIAELFKTRFTFSVIKKLIPEKKTKKLLNVKLFNLNNNYFYLLELLSL